MITLSSQSFAETLQYKGTYCKGEPDSPEFNFVLIVDYEDEIEAVGLKTYWENGDVPENYEEIEKEIKKKYLER